MEAVAVKQQAHTPGPWNVRVTPESSYQEAIVTHRGADGKTYRVTAVDLAADAALIAAAPDLLAALSDCAALFRGIQRTGGTQGHERQIAERIALADAAIAKAAA